MTCSENITPRDAECILRHYAEIGEYEIIWANSIYYEAVKVLAPEYPDIAWMVTGGGNEPIGRNARLSDVFIHEPAYLAGIIVGYMTEINKLGVVAAFTFGNGNAPVNTFYDGAISVNPDATAPVTYIESWFDSAKGKEATTAQIAAGADIIYAEHFGLFEAAEEVGAMLTLGHFIDQNSLALDIVVAISMAQWNSNIRNIVEAWYDHTVNATPYDAPMETLIINFLNGVSMFSPYHSFEDKIPPEAKDAVEATNQAILSGELAVTLKTDAFEEKNCL